MLSDAIADLPKIEAGRQVDPIPYVPAPGTRAPEWARDGCDGPSAELLYDHVSRDVREDDLQAFRALEPGGTYLDVPKELRRYDDENFTDKYKRLEWDRPSRTITAHIARDGYWYIHPDQHRTLSIREAARVQTFPDWYVFAGFPSNRFVQIGNAVPPRLGYAIGRTLLLGTFGEPRAQRGSASSCRSRRPRRRTADRTRLLANHRRGGGSRRPSGAESHRRRSHAVPDGGGGRIDRVDRRATRTEGRRGGSRDHRRVRRLDPPRTRSSGPSPWGGGSHLPVSGLPRSRRADTSVGGDSEGGGAGVWCRAPGH